jgi:hypothetical protein
MTNAFTLDGVLEFILLATVPPFIIAFSIHYARYRKAFTALIIGVLSLELLIIISIIFMALGLQNAGGVSGLLAGVIGLFIYPVPPIKAIELKNIRYLNKKQIQSIIVILVLLMSMQTYYSHSKTGFELQVNDPENDLIYAGGDYKTPEKQDTSIDIISMTSRLEGDNVILEMELAGDAAAGAEYRFYVSTHESNLESMRGYIVKGGRIKPVDRRIVLAEIPINSLENRDVFQILAVAGKYDDKTGMEIIDNCSSETLLRKILKRILF